MSFEEALETCNDRITYCANLYGHKWREEEPFLKTCRDGLEIALKYFDGILNEEEKEYLKDVFELHFMDSIHEVARKDEIANAILKKLELIE